MQSKRRLLAKLYLKQATNKGKKKASFAKQHHLLIPGQLLTLNLNLLQLV
jgi:hypothetical protein